jgi:ribokinase
MNRKPIITVVGSYIVGLTMRTDRFPTPGETLMGHSFNQFYGGKGSNQAVGCDRLGADVNMVKYHYSYAQ